MPGIAAKQPHEPPFVSVIVPARNEERIGRTLEALLQQDYAGRYEVIVADGQSTDGTVAIVRSLQGEYAHLRLVRNERCWSSAGRNRAIEQARGDIVVLVDAHCEPPAANYVENVSDAFERSGAACLGRPQSLDIADASTVQRAIAIARSSWLGHHPDWRIYSGREAIVPPQSVAVAYRRWVFDEVGFFDEAFDACEDVEFNQRVDRAGLSCFFTPRIALRYVPRSNLLGLSRQMIRYGRGRARLLRKHPETFSLGSIVPALFLLGLAAGTVLAWFSPWLALAFAGAVGCYGAIVGVVSLALCLRKRQARLFGWLLAVFPAIHLGAGVGFLWEMLAGPQENAPATPPEPAAAWQKSSVDWKARASTALEE